MKFCTRKKQTLLCVRKEIESLQLVAPLLSDELPSDDELTRKPANSAQETLDRSNGSERQRIREAANPHIPC
jgi:hypothetical protein